MSFKNKTRDAKVIPGAPLEVFWFSMLPRVRMQFEQAKEFTKATDVTGLHWTKLDGTPKVEL